MSSGKKPKNKYVTKSHLSERKFRELLRLFCDGVTALSAAELAGLNHNTVNRYYGLLRGRIAEICERDSPFDSEVEADESYFGPWRIGAEPELARVLWSEHVRAALARARASLSYLHVSYPSFPIG